MEGLAVGRAGSYLVLANSGLAASSGAAMEAIVLWAAVAHPVCTGTLLRLCF